jgi:hypothetical protein
MLKTAFAAALVVGAASAAQAQTYTFTGPLKGASATLTFSSGVGTGTFLSSKKGSSETAVAFENDYAGLKSFTISTIDTAKGTDYDYVIVVDTKKKSYKLYTEESTDKPFKLSGKGKVKTKK